MSFTMDEFNEAVEQLTVIDTAKARELMEDSEEHLVFIGRGTCPFCRKFLPKLLNVTEEKNIPVSFLDSTDSPSDEALSDLRYEIGAKTVPSLVYFGGENGFTNLNVDSSDSEEHIASLVK